MGVYYLHENGSLIWKNSSVFNNTTMSEYFNSPFVKKYWVFPDEPPGNGDEKSTKHFILNFLTEAYKYGAKLSEVNRIADANLLLGDFRKIISKELEVLR